MQTPALRKYYVDFGGAGDLGYVAEDNDRRQPIGAAWVRLVNSYGYIDDETPELAIAVMPAYRGHGIGTALLTVLMNAARSQFAAISLSVWPDNPAFQLYRRLGFEVVKRNVEDVIMVKQLVPVD